MGIHVPKYRTFSCDNAKVGSLASKPILHGLKKNRRNSMFILLRDKVASKEIAVFYVPIKEQSWYSN